MSEHTPCESFRVIPSESTFREKITIHPVTITNDTFQNELTVTLPADAVEEEDNDHTATVTVRADSRLNALFTV